MPVALALLSENDVNHTKPSKTLETQTQTRPRASKPSEAGRLLQIPEMVPFRLTRDIVAGRRFLV